MMLTPSSRVAINGQFTLSGRSRAGDGTCFVIPELKWMFDCGAAVSGSSAPPSHIFLTHAHNDHILCLTRILQNIQMASQSKPLSSTSAAAAALQIYLPASVKPPLEKYLQAWKELTDGDDTEAQAKSYPYQLHGLLPNTEVEIECKGFTFLVKAVECDHRVTCYGYALCQKKSRLKPEYQGEEHRRQIGKLKQQGVEIFDYVIEPFFTFLGDTTPAVFERHPEILTSSSATSVVVVECSFLLEPDIARAQKTKHTHWQHLEPFVLSNPNTLFVLIHFSLRYSARFIAEFFRDYRNVHPMLIQSEVNARNKHNHIQSASFSTSSQQEPLFCTCFRCQPTITPAKANDDPSSLPTNETTTMSHKSKHGINNCAIINKNNKREETETDFPLGSVFPSASISPKRYSTNNSDYINNTIHYNNKNGNNDLCHNCGASGHWARDCPAKHYQTKQQQQQHQQRQYSQQQYPNQQRGRSGGRTTGGQEGRGGYVDYGRGGSAGYSSRGGEPSFSNRSSSNSSGSRGGRGRGNGGRGGATAGRGRISRGRGRTWPRQVTSS